MKITCFILSFLTYALFSIPLIPLQAEASQTVQEIQNTLSQETETASPYGQALLESINRYRQQHELSALHFDARLIHLAKDHSLAMAHDKTLSHHDFDLRFSQAASRLCVENVGWNYPVPLALFEGWRHSSGHEQNMRKDGITRAGIAEADGYVTFFACQ